MVITNEFVKVGDAAKTIGFSVQHTRLLVRQGQLRGTKIGRDWIIQRESLHLFLVRRSTKPMSYERKPGRPPTVPSGRNRHP